MSLISLECFPCISKLAFYSNFLHSLGYYISLFMLVTMVTTQLEMKRPIHVQLSKWDSIWDWLYGCDFNNWLGNMGKLEKELIQKVVRCLFKGSKASPYFLKGHDLWIIILTLLDWAALERLGLRNVMKSRTAAAVVFPNLNYWNQNTHCWWN